MNKQHLTILIVDDTPENVVFIQRFVTALGHVAISACNGLEAVESFKENSPDLVLMDVMMPVMDGYEATTRIKEIAGDKWIPVIFLSALGEDFDQVKGLEMGGDDYLTKPVHLVILAAKIRAMQRISNMQKNLSVYAEELELYRDNTEIEQHLAKHLLDRIIRSHQADSEIVDSWMQPATHFSGDVIVSAAAPGNKFYFMLADATGHGLTAAINVLPAIEVFYSMTEKGFSIASLARELNNKIKQLMPTDRFIAATLISIDMIEQTIEVWNGGNPDALFLNQNGKILRKWKSRQPALGILSDDLFDPKPEVFQWTEAGQIFICSDGLPEAENPDGDAFGWSGLFDILASTAPAQRIGAVIESVNLHLMNKPGKDDISLATLNCPIVLPSRPEVNPIRKAEAELVAHLSKWKLGLVLSATQLKSLDILPFLMGWLDQLDFTNEHRSKIFLVLSELFNNALDHGILHMDSSLKATPDGFEQFMDTRAERLSNLVQGKVEIDLEYLSHQPHDFLQIHVRDSGEGFEYHHWMNRDISMELVPSGRGIALVKSMCADFTFMGNGNEAIALYPIDFQ